MHITKNEFFREAREKSKWSRIVKQSVNILSENIVAHLERKLSVSVRRAMMFQYVRPQGVGVIVGTGISTFPKGM